MGQKKINIKKECKFFDIIIKLVLKSKILKLLT